MIWHFEAITFIFEASFEELDPYLVSTACIWIATKGCEELTLRLRDVVNVVYGSLNPNSKPLALDDDYYDLRHDIWKFTVDSSNKNDKRKVWLNIFQFVLEVQEIGYKILLPIQLMHCKYRYICSF